MTGRLVLLFLFGLAGPAAAEPVIAIEGGKLHIEPGKVIDGATVLIRADRITAVGKTVAVPAGAIRIDARGMVITAGLVDASTSLGLSEVAMVAATNEGRFGGGKDSIHAAYRVINPIYNLPSSFDRINAREDNATILVAAGVKVAISTLGGATNLHTLPQLAGNGVRHGLSFAAALAAITTVPAEIFGVKDRGRVVAGAIADLVVWSGDRLELSSHPVHVIMSGVEQPTRTRQTLLYERYRSAPAEEAPGP